MVDQIRQQHAYCSVANERLPNSCACKMHNSRDGYLQRFVDARRVELALTGVLVLYLLPVLAREQAGDEREVRAKSGQRLRHMLRGSYRAKILKLWRYWPPTDGWLALASSGHLVVWNVPSSEEARHLAVFPAVEAMPPMRGSQMSGTGPSATALMRVHESSSHFGT